MDATHRHMGKKRKQREKIERRKQEWRVRRWWKQEQITANQLIGNGVVQRWK